MRLARQTLALIGLLTCLVAGPGLAQVTSGGTGGTGGGAVSTQITGDCTKADGATPITCTKTSGTSFGTAATKNTGTSGNAIPLLNAATNTWSGTTSFVQAAASNWLSVDYSAIDANASVFTCGAQTFAGVNLPGSARNDTVFNCPTYNIASNGTRLNTADVGFRLGFENFYLQGGTGIPASEFHIEYIDTAGNTHRLQTYYLARDGGAGSSKVEEMDRISYQGYTPGTEQMLIDWTSHVIDFKQSNYLRFDVNNTVINKQWNSAGSTYLALPYLDNFDNLLINQAPYIIAPPTLNAGGFRASFSLSANNTVTTGDTIMSIGGVNTLTGNACMICSSGVATQELWQQQKNTGVGNSFYEAATNSGNTTADPLYSWCVYGSTCVTAGIDNSTATREWRMENSFHGLGTSANTMLSIDPVSKHVGLGITFSATYGTTVSQNLNIVGAFNGAFGTTGNRMVASAQTITDTTTVAGTVANTYVDRYGVATLASTNALTLTNVYASDFECVAAGTNVTITNNYCARFAGSITVTGTTKEAQSQLTHTTTVAGLATCNAAAKGTWDIVTDATAPTYLGGLTGGGPITVPVWCDGVGWTSH